MLIQRSNGGTCCCQGFFVFSKLDPRQRLVKLPKHLIDLFDLVRLLTDCGCPQPVSKGQRRYVEIYGHACIHFFDQ